FGELASASDAPRGLTFSFWLGVLLDSESLYKTSRQVVSCSSNDRKPAISCHVQRFSTWSAPLEEPVSRILVSDRRFFAGRWNCPASSSNLWISDKMSATTSPTPA